MGQCFLSNAILELSRSSSISCAKIFATTIASSCLLLSACGGDSGDQSIDGVSRTPIIQCEISNASLKGNRVLPITLPGNLIWQTNVVDPEFTDPLAKRGGVFRTFMLTFPMTLRRVGPDSNGAFANYLRPLMMGTTQRHPNTLNHMPQLASSWAFGADGKTVYFKLNPKARWSDGQPVKAEDYLFAVYQMRSKFIVDPWYNDYYTNVLVDIRKYDDYTIGVAGKAPRPPDEMLEEYGVTPTACRA